MIRGEVSVPSLTAAVHLPCPLRHPLSGVSSTLTAYTAQQNFPHHDDDGLLLTMDHAHFTIDAFLNLLARQFLVGLPEPCGSHASC